MVDLMRHAIPDLTPAAARSALCKRAEHTDAPDMQIGTVNSEVLRDVILPQDHEAVEGVVADKIKNLKVRRVFNKHADEIVAKHFASRPMSAAAKKLAKPKDVTALTEARIRRQFAQGQHLHFIEEWSPAGGKVVQDNSNGRYLCTYPGHGRKSFSWTRRGPSEAAKAVLDFLWKCHLDSTGEDRPWPSEYLQ